MTQQAEVMITVRIMLVDHDPMGIGELSTDNRGDRGRAGVEIVDGIDPGDDQRARRHADIA